MSDYSAGQVALVRGADQEVACTASRRSGPRRWLRAARWLIAAGLHGRANTTTLAIAEDLGTRMDYDTGHVRYCLDELAARIGVSRATVKRHVAVLRELGALAWVVHGTKRNVRRALGMKGYAATATVYAAVIPPVYDHAMGHTIVGSGYEARAIVDQRSQGKPVDKSPVDNAGSEACEPPSLTLVKEESQVQMGGGFNYTPRAGRELHSIPHQTNKRSNDGGHRRSASDVEHAHRVVRLVRALVNWTQRVPLRRLEFVLRPLTDRGLDARQIADELHGMTLGWRPAKPAEFIQARLEADAERQAELDQYEAELEAAVAPMDNQAMRDLMSLKTLFAQPEPERTDEDRLRARMDWNVWPEVLDHLDDDPDDANDLYGEALCKYAIGRQDLIERRGAWV
ncbi:hypothetical protein [Streptomyces sp. NPDC056982]|uniref:hypothetical protein n=1 Tax=Streptomyces sp. NPDC056982 TaxID=3345986 RepID=UPI0036279040